MIRLLFNHNIKDWLLDIKIWNYTLQMYWWKSRKFQCGFIVS